MEVISDRYDSVNMKNEMEEHKQLTQSQVRNTMIRTKLGRSDREGFIIDLTQHPEEIEKREDKSPTQYQDIEN